MPNLLGVTNPVSGHDNANVNRNIHTSPNNTQIQNAPDLEKITRADNRTEQQGAGDHAGVGRGVRYDSNFHTFLQRLNESPDLTRTLSALMNQYGGTVVASGMGEGIATEMATLMSMMKMVTQ